MSQGALAHIEAGDRSATIGTLLGVAKALGITLSDLLASDLPVANPPKAEKAWFRLCTRLRDRDDAYIQTLEQFVRALDSLEQSRSRRR
jgi:transcriptional regulator with XRE-family HTH domain